MKTKSDQKTLAIITGPTAVGKTNTSIIISKKLNAEIISADARQFYRELKIGTAAPTPHELSMVPHHFAGHLSIFDSYNAITFAHQALSKVHQLFEQHDFVVVTGGSGLYLDALTGNIDDLPDVDLQIREKVQRLYQNEGIDSIRLMLQKVDPEFYNQVDIHNPNRMMRGLEIYLGTGKKFSELRTNPSIEHPFQIKRIVINRPRPELAQRIHLRTQQMIEKGLVEEARQNYQYRHLNALNTVGYKELFEWMDNQVSFDEAVEKIRVNTRRYAKRQITWFKRYDDAKWFLPSEINSIIRFITL